MFVIQTQFTRTGPKKEEIGYKVTAFKVHNTDKPCEFTFKDWRNAAVGLLCAGYQAVVHNSFSYRALGML